MKLPIFAALAVLWPISLPAAEKPEQAESQAKEDQLILEVAKRLPDFDPSTAKPRVREAFERHIVRSRGTAGYLELVSRLKMTSEVPQLTGLLTKSPKGKDAASITRVLLQLGASKELTAAVLQAQPETQAHLLVAVANTNMKEAGALLLDIASQPTLPAATKEAMGKQDRILAAVKKAAESPALSAKDKATAEMLLSGQAPAMTAAAAALTNLGGKPLPSVADLAKRKGDATSGHAAFGKYCQTCHQVGTTGIDFGPALTEIGGKMGKEALYDTILNPNAGISFGFEGFEVTTKAGDTYIGMIKSETADKLSLKVPGGVIIDVTKTEVVTRKKLPVSLMTPGLNSVMPEQELVDLIEYLTTLKAK